MVIPIISGLIDLAKEGLKLIPDGNKRRELEAALDQRGIEASLQLAQMQADINKIEAANPSLFVSGWRPAIGWICGFGLAWQYVLAPIANWLVEVGHLSTTIPKIQADGLMELLFGMLGLAGMRTYEKIKDVHRV